MSHSRTIRRPMEVQALRIPGIRDSAAFAAAVLRVSFRRHWYVRKALARGVTWDELQHIGLTAMWEFSLSHPEATSFELGNAAGRALYGFISDELGKLSVLDHVQGFPEEIDLDELKYLASHSKPVDAVTAESDFVANCYSIVISSARSMEQGYRDFEVISRWLTGMTTIEIAEACPWLKSARRAAERIHEVVFKLRRELGGDIEAPFNLQTLEGLSTKAGNIWARNKRRKRYAVEGKTVRGETKLRSNRPRGEEYRSYHYEYYHANRERILSNLRARRAKAREAKKGESVPNERGGGEQVPLAAA